MAVSKIKSVTGRKEGADQSQSPLMRLPPELRTQIYRAAFQAGPKRLKSVRLHPCMWHTVVKAPGVVLACKQVHSEALALFYSCTTF